MRLGLTSFGGPIAHVGYFRRTYVERRGWIDEQELSELVAIANLLPGPSSSQLGIAVGARRAGVVGGIAAWLGFTLPSAVAMTAFAVAIGSADVSGAGWVHGLELVAVPVVALAVLSMTATPASRKLLRSTLARCEGDAIHMSTTDDADGVTPPNIARFSPTLQVVERGP